jgi:hypothetical protein
VDDGSDVEESIIKAVLQSHGVTDGRDIDQQWRLTTASTSHANDDKQKADKRSTHCSSVVEEKRFRVR